jgi:hypothetical protein
MLARRGLLQIIKLGHRSYMDRVDLDRAMQAGKLEIPE